MSLADFENVIRANLNPQSNEMRMAAEAELVDLKKKNPALFFTGLSEIMMKSSDGGVRSFAAVIFRKSITIMDDTFDNIPGEARQSVQNNVLNALMNESDRSVRLKLGDSLGALACRVLPRAPWEDLQRGLITLSQSSSPESREAFLIVLYHVAEFAPDILHDRMAEVRDAISKSLVDDFHPVRCAAMKACVSILRSVDDVSQLGDFSNIIPVIFQCLSAGGTDVVVGSHCEQLQILLENRVQYFEKDFVPIMKCLIGLVNEGGLSWSTRRQAMNLCVTLVQLTGHYNPIEVATQMVPLGFAFLEQFDPTIEWNSPADDQDQENFEFGAECLQRLADILGEEIFLMVAQPILERNFNSSDWKNRLIALGAVKNVVEICANSWQTKLKDVVQVAGASLSSDHPYVRYMALSALLQICVVYGEDPDFHGEFHQPIMHASEGMMRNEQHRCVLSQTCELVTHFCYSCPEELLVQYAEGLLECLLVLLGRNDPLVQASACKSVSVVASNLEEKFAGLAGGEVYRKFIQAGQQLLQIPVDPSSSDELFQLRGQAMELLGLIIASCPSVSAPDGHHIMSILRKQINQEKQMGLISYNYMIRLFTSISSALGSEFAQYLDDIIPGLIESSKLVTTHQFDVDDPNAPTEARNIVAATVRVSVLGEKKICIDTDALAEKQCAVEQLAKYADIMEADFFPYVEPVFVALKPCMKETSAIRTWVVEAMPALVNSFVLGVNRQGGNGQAQSQEMCLAVIPLLIEAVHQEGEVEGVCKVFGSISEILQTASPQLPPELIQELVEVVANTLSERQYRTQREHDAESEDFELDSVSEEAEGLFADSVTDLIGCLAKIGQQNFVLHFDNTVSKMCVELLNADSLIGDRILGLGIFTEVVDKTGADAQRYVTALLSECQRGLVDSDAGMRQQAAYTVGICAKSGYMVNCDGYLSLLKQLVDDSSSRTDENIAVTENCISAIGKICKYHPDKCDVGSIFPTWLRMLPIENDDEEREFCNEYLFEQLQGPFKDVVVSDKAVMIQILKIFGNAIVHEDSHTQQFGQVYQFMVSKNGNMVRDCLSSGMLDEKYVNVLNGAGTCA